MNDYVHIEAADLCRPNARFTPERQGYQVLTPFGKLGYSQIAQGVAPWQKPWKPGESRLPKNIQANKPYRGGNSVYLSVTQTAKGYSDHRWATYK